MNDIKNHIHNNYNPTRKTVRRRRTTATAIHDEQQQQRLLLLYSNEIATCVLGSRAMFGRHRIASES